MREAFSVSATTTGETTVNHEIAEQRGASARDRLLSAGRQFEAAQIAPAPQSQVEAALNQIDAGKQDLQSTIKRIAGRLDPVLSAVGISAEGGAQQAEPASSTPLVRRLNDLATELRKDCAALQDLERRLAL